MYDCNNSLWYWSSLLTTLGSEDGHQSFYPWKFLKYYLRNDHRKPEEVEYVTRPPRSTRY